MDTKRNTATEGNLFNLNVKVLKVTITNLNYRIKFNFLV